MSYSAECRARAAEYERKAEASANAGVRQFYQSLAQHWRSLALMAEAKTEREQAQRERSERELAGLMRATRTAAKPTQFIARKR